MITGNQLFAHMVGDYIFQSDWMAQNKTKSWKAAIIHAITYTLPFVFITRNILSLSVICVSHAVIDRYRLARYVNWLKNGASGEITNTGYSPDRPDWLVVWLLVITDNILHVFINGLAIRFL
ncbi:DUF3307 domain-containing protein [bacterium]|nr:DUF3307 domain-containing protein [bacterium]